MFNPVLTFLAPCILQTGGFQPFAGAEPQGNISVGTYMHWSIKIIVDHGIFVTSLHTLNQFLEYYCVKCSLSGSIVRIIQ